MNELTTNQNTTPVVQKEQPTMAMQILALAQNPDFDVDKLGKLIDLQNAEMQRQAKVAFSTNFAKLQAEIPTIVEDKSGNGSSYATLETIVDVTRPILNKYGFSVTFDVKTTMQNTPTKVGDNFIFLGFATVKAVLIHELGHSIDTETCIPFDFSGSKKANTAQAQGSAISYGKRYAYCSLLNITTRNCDDDAEMLSKSFQVKITVPQAKQLQALHNNLADKTGFDGYLMQQFGSSDIANIPKGAYNMVLSQLQQSQGAVYATA